MFGLNTLVAAFGEEVIFRGYLVVENRGRAALITGMIGASLGFALLHPFLWEWREGGLASGRWDQGLVQHGGGLHRFAVVLRRALFPVEC